EFVKRIDKELVEINRVLAIKHDRIETEKDKKKFNKADICWICKEKFVINEDKVKSLENKVSWLNKKLEDTSENSEDYKTLTKQIDKITKDINHTKSMDIKVWDHCHITGYDSHLICESVEKSVNAHQITVIAEIFEQYKSMKNLGTNHPITSQYFKDYSSDQISLASRKGVYPYEYFDSQDRFKETELPPIYEFFSTLKGEYHDLYLKIDLDPSHYVSAPALSWNAMLKKTGVEIELFTDISMHDFIEEDKCRGISIACKRYFKANNSKIGKAFNLSKPTT
ncbi:985_t:CDS:2, partial [Ambispora leptoticha]